ncbi:MAG: M16 family metallopeptidase [Ignavibacteria bacterium]
MKYSKIPMLSLTIMFALGILTGQTHAQINPINFEEFTMKNGLHVILHKDVSAPNVAVLVQYRVGARDEDPKRTGFAHFFEHLMFEATDYYKRASLDKLIQGAGGELNAYTSFDETVYHFEVPSNEVRLPLWIEASRMRTLHVDSIGVETQRGVVKEERKNRYDNSPYGDWFERTSSKLFNNGMYSWTPIGSAQHIDNASIEEFKDFYNNFYQPNNATLVVSGDIDVKQVKGFVNEYFGKLPKGPQPKRSDVALKPMNPGIIRETIDDQKAQLPAVFMGYRGPKIGEKDAYAMSMLMDSMRSGESSRLYQRLVDKDQIAVQASGGAQNLQASGMMFGLAIVAPGKTPDEVIKAIDEEIEKVKKDGVTDEEFLKAKNIAEVRFIEGKKNVLEKARSLARYHTYFGKASMINTEIKDFMSIKKEDLKRVANQYFTQDSRVILQYMPKQKQ